VTESTFRKRLPKFALELSFEPDETSIVEGTGVDRYFSQSGKGMGAPFLFKKGGTANLSSLWAQRFFYYIGRGKECP
jgi:hypothetical protein